MQRLIMTEKNVDETEEYGGDATLVPMSSVPHINNFILVRFVEVMSFLRGVLTRRETDRIYRFLRRG